MTVDAERQRLEFLPGVAAKLGWYVYALGDPRHGNVFYIGKGKGNRAYQHAKHAAAACGSLLGGFCEIARRGIIRSSQRTAMCLLPQPIRPVTPSGAMVDAARTPLGQRFLRLATWRRSLRGTTVGRRERVVLCPKEKGGRSCESSSLVVSFGAHYALG